MRQLRQLNQLWSWIPAFRAVGETQHLPTAAKHLLVSPSALSRAIRLLEDELEAELFVRSPRGLQLTEEGVMLLGSIRNAMQTVDETVGVIRARRGNRRLTVATSTPFARELVLPALGLLGPARPLLRIESIAQSQVMSKVRSGLVDLALMADPKEDPELLIEPLMPCETAIYCGAEHPLVRAQHLTVTQLQRYPFVAPPRETNDGWPPDVERTVGIELEQLSLAIEACIEGDLLAIFPELAARRAERLGQLHRLPVDIGHPFDVYTVRRTPTRRAASLDQLVNALRQRALRLGREAQRTRSGEGDTLRLSVVQ